MDARSVMGAGELSTCWSVREMASCCFLSSAITALSMLVGCLPLVRSESYVEHGLAAADVLVDLPHDAVVDKLGVLTAKLLS